jgi:hypothetical protein
MIVIGFFACLEWRRVAISMFFGGARGMCSRAVRGNVAKAGVGEECQLVFSVEVAFRPNYEINVLIGEE